MKYIRDTYARYAVRIHEIAKFGVVGGIGFFVQLGVTDAAHLGLGVGALSAVVVGYIVATVVTFLGNRHWAFKHRRGKGLGHETMLFVLLNVVGLGIQEAVVATVHYGLHMTDPLSYNVANIVGIGLGTLFRLWSYRKWVFLDVNEEPAEVAPTVLPHEMPPPTAPHPHGAQPTQAYQRAGPGVLQRVVREWRLRPRGVPERRARRRRAGDRPARDARSRAAPGRRRDAAARAPGNLPSAVGQLTLAFLRRSLSPAVPGGSAAWPERAGVAAALA